MEVGRGRGVSQGWGHLEEQARVGDGPLGRVCGQARCSGGTGEGIGVDDTLEDKGDDLAQGDGRDAARAGVLGGMQLNAQCHHLRGQRRNTRSHQGKVRVLDTSARGHEGEEALEDAGVFQRRGMQQLKPLQEAIEGSLP